MNLGQPQHLGELLREVEGSPQLMWYRQCPKARVKAKFLMAVAGLVRALLQGNPLLKPLVEAHPALQSLAQKIVKRLFVLPSHGNILESWHEGRLACYNATLSSAAQQAADKLKDELQVSLVAAVRRSAGNPPQADDKSGRPGPKPAAPLEVQLREWPMSGCPLARALLEFLKARAADLGDFGRPSLREVPPHCLKPATLRNLLSRLDAFELVGPGPTCLVRLKFEAVAALTYKAVGTKPKARAGPPTSQEGSMSPPEDRASGAQFEANMDAFDYSNVDLMSRLIRRGLLAGDETWRQSWTQFCWKKGISSRLSSRNSSVGPPQEILASFLQSHLSKLKRATWARSLLEDQLDGRGANASRSRDVATRDHRNGSSRGHEEHRGRTRAHSRRADASQHSEWSDASVESRDRRRKKHRRRDKKYGDFFNKNMSPEVMMMRAQMMRAQMVGVSMVMNSMMGMQNIIPPAPPPPPAPYASTAASWPNGGAATSSSAPARTARPRPAAPAPAAQRPPRSLSLKALAAPARKQPASAIDMDDL